MPDKSATDLRLESYKAVLAAPGLLDEIYRQAFDNSVVGKAVVDGGGWFIKVNRKYCETVGYSPPELLGKMRFQDITMPSDLEPDVQLAEKTRAGEIDGYDMRKSYLHKRGYVVPVHLWVSRVVGDSGGEPVLMLAQVTEDKARPDADCPERRPGRIDLDNMPDDEQIGLFSRLVYRLGFRLWKVWVPLTGTGFVLYGANIGLQYQTRSELVEPVQQAKEAARQAAAIAESLKDSGQQRDDLLKDMARQMKGKAK